MPGLSIFYGDVQRESDNLHVALEKMLHFEDWDMKEIYKSRGLFVGFTGYITYPLEIIQKEDLFIAIEGYVYNKNRESIISVCRQALNWIRSSKKKSGDFEFQLQEFDGEFLIFCSSRNDRSFVLFNDVLGRLPFYYMVDGDELLMSRELKFFKYVKNSSLEIDKLSVAHQLLFSSFLSNNTYFTNVKRLMPASKIYCNKESGRIKAENYYQLNFEQQKVGERSADEEAEHIGELFLKYCENRLKQIDHKKLVLALSDGFDSRTVLAALNNYTSDIDTITYTGWKGEMESKLISEMAQKVADFHKNRWESLPLTQTNIGEMEKMIRLYDATIPSVSPWHQLLPYIRKKYGKKVLFLTGDEGDQTLAPLSLSEVKNARDIDELVDIIFANLSNRLFSLQDVQELLNIRYDEIIGSIKDLLSEFPEKTLVGKYTHSSFVITGFNWNFTREDEYRYYFRYTSFFWSPPFAKEAIPLRAKYDSYSEIYTKVMERLNAYMNVSTDRYASKKTYLQKVKSSIKQIKTLRGLNSCIKRVRKYKAKPFKPFEPYIMRHVEEYDNTVFRKSCIFSQEALNRFADKSMSKAHFERLFTVSKYCQDFFEKSK